MRFFVTGAAGFVGSNLVDRLLARGHEVTGFDNFSTGQRRFLAPARAHPAFTVVAGDLLEIEPLSTALTGCDVVFHFAANADVRHGGGDTSRDLRQNTIATSNVLAAMRQAGVRRIVFASTASVYGDASIVPTPENAPFPLQTSFYGASKLAAEGLIAAYAAAFGFQAHVFRFVSLLGPRYTHGHVFDFLARLSQEPDHLSILGNGEQRKSYLHVDDAIDAILIALEKATDPVNIFNTGHDETLTVRQSAETICRTLGLSPQLQFGTEARGWVGDSPLISLDCSKLKALGWQPRLSPRDGVIATVDYLRRHPDVVSERLQKNVQCGLA